jgi:hypothetical protein
MSRNWQKVCGLIFVFFFAGCDVIQNVNFEKAVETKLQAKYTIEATIQRTQVIASFESHVAGFSSLQKPKLKEVKFNGEPMLKFQTDTIGIENYQISVEGYQEVNQFTVTDEKGKTYQHEFRFQPLDFQKSEKFPLSRTKTNEIPLSRVVSEERKDFWLVFEENAGTDYRGAPEFNQARDMIVIPFEVSRRLWDGNAYLKLIFNPPQQNLNDGETTAVAIFNYQTSLPVVVTK